jgi:hypothetical protein
MIRGRRTRETLARMVTAWSCRAAVALAIVGVFGTWRAAGAVSLDGFEGPHNGWLVLSFGLIALAGAGSLARGGWLGILTVLGCGSVMLYGAVLSLAEDGDVLGGRSGWGVWLAAAASGLLVSLAVAAAGRRLTGSTRAGPRTSP